MADHLSAARHDPRSRTRRRQRLTSPDQRLDLRTTTIAPGVVIVTAAGEIDLANRAALAEALSTAVSDLDIRLLVCDLTNVGFLACTGVSALLDVRSELDVQGAVLRVVATDPTVLRVLDATGQLEALGVRPTLASALAGYAEPPPPPDAPPTLAHLRTALDAAVQQTTSLAELCGRLADQVAAVDATRLVDVRGGHWRPRDTLADMAEDLRALQNHLATGALLAAPTVEDLGHLRDSEHSTRDN
jgi:anti-anti-sigma factor